MLRARSALCLIVLAACSDGRTGGAEKREEPIDALVSGPDAPLSGPGAPVPGPDAPVSGPDACAMCQCVAAPPTVQVSPHTSPPTAAGTQAAFDVAVMNNDSPACAPSRYELRTRLDAPP